MRVFPCRPALNAVAVAVLFGASSIWLPSALAQASDQAVRAFDIKVAAQPLADALNELSRQTGVPIFASGDLIAEARSQAVSGRLTLEQALRAMLRGHSLEAVQTPQGGYAIRRTGSAEGAALPVVVVKAERTRESSTGRVEGYVARVAASGSKTDTPIIETPQSITVVTSDFMKAIGATRLRDALAYTPGVNISPWGADSRHDWINLRGLNAFSPGYSLDGMQMRNVNTQSTWQTESYGTERIEVLRGPSSVLYGQNIAGGMVNVISKRPTAEPLHELQLQLGDHARRQLNADFSGPVDDEGKLLYRVTALVRDAEIKFAGLPDDRSFIAPALTWKPSSDTSLTVLSQVLRIRTSSDYSVYPAAGTLLPNPNGRISPSTYLGDPRISHYDYDQWMLGYQFEHRIDDTWTVRQNARQGHLDADGQDVIMYGGFVATNPGSPSDPVNFRTVRRYVYGGDERARTFTIDNQVQARVRANDWEHTVLFGIDFQRTRYETVNPGLVVLPNVDVYSPVLGNYPVTQPPVNVDQDIRLDQAGLYVQDQIRFQDHWVATLGGRFDRASRKHTNRLNGIRTDNDDEKFSGRAGLVYLHPSGWAPYASYAESFSPVTEINPDTNAVFEPETGKQLEAGVRYQPPGTRSSYSAAVFDLRRQNYISRDAQGRARQTGEVSIRGLELEAALQPVRNSNLVASYAYTPTADVTQSSRPLLLGKQNQPVSRNQLAVWGDYRLPVGVTLGLGARHVGSHRGMDESSLAKVPGYTLVDALVAYEVQRWSLALNVRNLANKTYVANCQSNLCFYGDQRKANFTATYRW